MNSMDKIIDCTMTTGGAAYEISKSGIRFIPPEEFYKQEKDYAIEEIKRQPFF